jgi:hypothetical protein
MYIQMVGRGLRSCKGKSDCIVLDQSGNTVVHGPIIGPSGYVPEPWGDDDPESTSATARPKHKLVREFLSSSVLAACSRWGYVVVVVYTVEAASLCRGLWSDVAF